MSQFVIETRVKKGHLVLKDIPFSDDTELKVILIPKFDVSKASFQKARKLSKRIQGNLSDDIIDERNGK
jgi:hypothetical protein